MLTQEEREKYLNTCVPPCPKLLKKQLKAVAQLKPGTLIWLSIFNRPVQFLSYQPNAVSWKTLQFHYLHLEESLKPILGELPYHAFIRIVTDRERRDLLNQLNQFRAKAQSQIDFINNATKPKAKKK